MWLTVVCADRLTDEIVAGAKATGAEVTLYQVPETLSKEILEKQYAIPRPDIPEIGPHDLPNFDGFIFGAYRVFSPCQIARCRTGLTVRPSVQASRPDTVVPPLRSRPSLTPPARSGLLVPLSAR